MKSEEKVLIERMEKSRPTSYRHPHTARGWMKYLIAVVVVLLTGVAETDSRTHTADYVPGMLYIRFREAARKNASGVSAEELLFRLGAVDMEQAFPTPPHAASRKMSPESRDLSESIAAIRQVSFPPNLDLVILAKKLSAHPGIDYAEPVYISKFSALPNDPLYTQQNQAYLDFIKAPAAWETAEGDTSVVIAIVDSGTDWNHPDLFANLWTNPGEIPDNGVDDDENGYEDDVHGWDFYGSVDGFGRVSGDNDPAHTEEPHGTHVAGIAAAVTNNGVGIASLSHNVRYMPLKAGPDNGDGIYYGYNAVKYAVDNGAYIINCSWGSPPYSRTGDEIMSYAESMGALVVAAAGNDGSTIEMFPAAYPGVLAVASVELNGTKSIFSNYGTYVDISAPGSYIFSTLLEDSYGFMSGTSMATPVVCSLAALIKSAHPDWDADQLKAQIMGTSSPLASGDPTHYLCGCGYINAERAVGLPVLLMDVVDYVFTDTRGNNDCLFSQGEEIEASITIRNLGDTAQDITVLVSSLTGYVTPLEASIPVGSLTHGEEKTVVDIPFTVNESVPVNTKDIIRVDFATAEGSVNHAMIDVMVNPSYATFTANTIEVSLDGLGHIGYINFPNNTLGSPFKIHDPSNADSDVFGVPLLFESGLIFGSNQSRISSSIRGEELGRADEDFVLENYFLFEKASDGSFQEGTVVFSDAEAGAESFGMTVTLNAFAFNDPGHDQYFILSYTFRNDGDTAHAGLRAGLFFDFDLPEANGNDDVGFYAAEDDILIMADNNVERDDRLMIGATCIGSITTPFIIDNMSEGHDMDSFGLYDGFTDEEKWWCLSAGVRDTIEKGPGDISMAVAPAPFSLDAGDEHQVVFILAYGQGYEELLEQVTNARLRAGELPSSVADGRAEERPEPFSITSAYPNPFNPETTIGISLPETGNIRISLYDVLGRRARTVFRGSKTAGRHAIRLRGEGLSSGLYIVCLENESGARALKKIMLLK